MRDIHIRIMHNDLDKALGEVLKNMRLEAGLTQQTAADELGVKQSTVSRWEGGYNASSLGTSSLVSTTALYGSTPAELYSTPVIQNAVRDAVPDQIKERAQRLAQNINQRHGR